MAKKKQPYIPFYTGDYLKDTRTMSLQAKGAWIDIIVFMWDSETRGMIEGDLYDISRMIGASVEETDAVLKEFCRKRICEVSEPAPGIIRIISRRMMKEAEISVKRSIAVQTRYKPSTKDITKSVQNTDIDNDNDIDNDIVINYKKESKEKTHTTVVDLSRETKPLSDEWFNDIFDEMFLEQKAMVYREHNIPDQLKKFKSKVIGAPGEYIYRDTAGMRNAFDYQLRHTDGKKELKNGTSKPKATLDEIRKFSK